MKRNGRYILITGVVFLFLMIGACLFFTIRENTKVSVYYDSSQIQNNSVELININTADKETLKLLPDINESQANAIISYREENGGFQNIEEIIQVKGIGEKTYQIIRTYITV
ncbi:MAG: ComEA family DNA-binding protein [Ruminococcus sp.]|nr:ComEA family DNA-binding protein [Ruminococcus sp.]